MLKQIIKRIVIFFLRIEASLVLRRYKPEIIAIGGSVGKTSSKDAIAAVLSGEFYVRKSEKSYNSELGVPLTILGVKSAWNNAFQWLFILTKAIKLLIVKHDYPKILVLEMGVGKPNDMERLLKIAKVDIGLLTALGETPSHIEHFQEADELIKEKIKLVKSINKEKWAVINGDDDIIKKERGEIKANIITYGLNEDVDIMASDYKIVFRKEKDQEIPEGITFKVRYKGNIVPVRLYDVFGVHHVYTALSAFCVGIIKELNIVEIAESLSRYKSPSGRLRLLKGVKRSFILDDTYNSSPMAVKSALEVLRDIPAPRKIAVLGDMLELGRYTIDEHKKIGRMIKGTVDLLFTIGPRSKFIADEAESVGFGKRKVLRFSTSEDAKKDVQEKIEEGDLILIKGSQAMRMEKITEEIMAEPEKKDELLVRQEKEWLNK